MTRWPAARVFCGSGLLSFAAIVLTRGSGRPYFVVTGLVLMVGLGAILLRRTRQHPVALVLGWLTPPALMVLLLLWMTGTLGDYVLSSTFERDTWIAKRGASFSDRTRLRMVEHLRASGRLDRLTQAEAVALLGDPDERRWGDDDRAWIWRLGPDRGIGIDSSWLRLKFGSDGRVESHRIVED